MCNALKTTGILALINAIVHINLKKSHRKSSNSWPFASKHAQSRAHHRSTPSPVMFSKTVAAVTTNTYFQIFFGNYCTTFLSLLARSPKREPLGDNWCRFSRGRCPSEPQHQSTEEKSKHWAPGRVMHWTLSVLHGPNDS